MTKQYAAQYAKGLNSKEIFYQFDEDEMILRFETEFADYFRGCDSDNVGGVVLYYRGDKCVGFFDYCNMVGSIYELGNQRSDELPWEWAERVGVEWNPNPVGV
jgi:hypothetical protein